MMTYQDQSISEATWVSYLHLLAVLASIYIISCTVIIFQTTWNILMKFDTEVQDDD